MHSCIYEGQVRHHRYVPVEHRFRYGLYLMYLDLNELPALVGRDRPISARRFATASFLPDDHLDSEGRSLDETVRDLVDQQAGFRPEGPIRLLTQLRHFGYYMAPLSLFYCFDQRGDVKAVVGEVVNTPWRERHCYVLTADQRVDWEAPTRRYRTEKEFHVSPFMDMDFQYHWQLSDPGERLHAEIASYKRGERAFDARLSLTRRELGRASVRRMSFRYPWMSARIVTAIYGQALRLWLKKYPFVPHPRKVHPSNSQPKVTALER